jgi:protein involved in polysaccharide export with SLBB domain
MVYVIGEVEKSGGFVLEERQSVSVLQALSLSGGLTAVAAVEHARILRGGEGGNAGWGGEENAVLGGGLSAGSGGVSVGEGSGGGGLGGGGLGGGGSLGGGGARQRVEIAVDLKAIMAGKSPDVALEREDILFVPRSGKRAASQALKKAALGTLTGIAIWRVGAH